MSKWAKFAEKLWSRQSDNNIEFDELVAYLERLDWEHCGGTGSHRKFAHKYCPAFIDIQARKDGKAKSYQVEQIRAVLDTYQGSHKEAWIEGRA